MNRCLEILVSTRPGENGRPPVRDGAAATVPFAVPDTFPHGDAAFVVAVHTLASRHSGQWSGVIGRRVDGSTVPQALDLGPDLPFTEAVRRVGDAGGAAALPGHDLVVRLRWTAGGRTGEIGYPVSLLDRAAAERLAARMSTLCAGVAADPGTPIGRIEVLPPAERAAALPPPRDAVPAVPAVPAVELIAERAARTPDAVAVECGADRFTYGQLMTRSAAIAGHLRRLGAGPGDLVGVAVPRGVDLLATLLGVHRAGAAYVPLDPEHPTDRLSYVLSDAGVRALVTSGAPLDAGQTPVVRLDDIRPTADPTPLPPVGLDDPAYVIYTSGSTGRPKGVAVTHRALTNFLWSMRERPGLAPGTVFPAVTTVSFDIAALELFLPLVVGGRVVISGPG